MVFARDWLTKILEHSDSNQVCDFGLKKVGNEKGKFDLNKLDDEINYLERRLMKLNPKIGFCHNDLQYGNIMLSEKDDSVTLIVCTSSQTICVIGPFSRCFVAIDYASKHAR